MAATKHIPRRDERISEAVNLIFEARHLSANERGFNAPNAWKLLKEIAADGREHLALMRIAMYRAKASTGYWVHNGERYCTRCRKSQPLEMYKEDEYTCSTCSECRYPRRKDYQPEESHE